MVGAAVQIATHEVAEYIQAQDIWLPKAPLSTSRFRFDGAYVEVGANQMVLPGQEVPGCRELCAPHLRG